MRLLLERTFLTVLDEAIRQVMVRIWAQVDLSI